MLGKPHPEQDRVGGRSGPPGRARVVRPFPRVGRSIPRATGGPDEWLLLPPPEREDRTRLTDLLRRIRSRAPISCRAAASPASSGGRRGRPGRVRLVRLASHGCPSASSGRETGVGTRRRRAKHGRKAGVAIFFLDTCTELAYKPE